MVWKNQKMFSSWFYTGKAISFTPFHMGEKKIIMWNWVKRQKDIKKNIYLYQNNIKNVFSPDSKKEKKKKKKIVPYEIFPPFHTSGKKKKITRNFFFSLGNIVKVCLPLREKVSHKKKKIHPVPYFSHFFLSIPHRKKKKNSVWKNINFFVCEAKWIKNIFPVWNRVGKKHS